jgi:hypothetical protein
LQRVIGPPRKIASIVGGVKKMDDISTLSTIVATVSVVVGVLFTMMEVRHLARSRRTEVILKIYERFGSKEIVEGIMKIGSEYKSFEDYVKKHGLSDTVQVLEVFDEVGVLLKRGLVDIDLVNDLFSYSVTPEWESRVLELVEGIRKNSNQPSFFYHVEYLFKQLDAYKTGRVKND